MPSLEELQQEGWIKAEAVSRQEIALVLERAREEASAAQKLFNDFPSPAYELAYNAMLLAVTALLYADGYRARVERHHKTLTEFAEARLGATHASLVAEFERAQRRRHQTTYGQIKATRQEAGHLVKKAWQLLEVIEQQMATDQ